MAFLPFKRQFFCFQAVRYAQSDSTVGSAAKGMWSSIEIRKNAMIVVISPNDGNLSRCLSVTPTAGDVFSSFIFNQKEKEN